MIFGYPPLDYPTPMDWVTDRPLFRSREEWAASLRKNPPSQEEHARQMIEQLRNPEIRKELRRAIEFLPRAAETLRELMKTYYRPGRPNGSKEQYRRVALRIARDALAQGRELDWDEIFEHKDVKPHVTARTPRMTKTMQAKLKESVGKTLERQARRARRQNPPS